MHSAIQPSAVDYRLQISFSSHFLFEIQSLKKLLSWLKERGTWQISAMIYGYQFLFRQ